LFIALLYFSFKHVPHSWQVGEKAVESVIRAPLYPVKTLIPVTCLMLLLQGVAELIRDLSTIFSRGKPEWS
jgi:TRAP-type mannitol/chloroaromatic compound transport system permease small subunit